jgi:UDP-N-acetyl-D-galactosamine dehydrogenase
MNDGMGEYVASQVVKLMIKKGVPVLNAEVLMLGITFKENCPDVRNTKTVDVISVLCSFGINVKIYGPWAKLEEVMHEYKLETYTELPKSKFDAIVLGVAHNEFLNINFEELKKENSLICDVKAVLQFELNGKL